MIARKITYKGSFNSQIVSTIFDITRKIEITGEVRPVGSQEIILNLEGDPSMILFRYQFSSIAKGPKGPFFCIACAEYNKDIGHRTDCFL